ncbi:molecular chaperone [Sphingomonas swuensis]|uniref:Molecular chaperone n=1 Tax=Sphingomonas swuensis TaxID=977800 RepID=A0ABP7SIC3_9SPHN
MSSPASCGRGLLRTFLAVAAFLSPAPSLHAGTIAVVPIRIELDPAATFCALHVSNLGKEPVAVQVRGFGWSQMADGSDRLEPAGIRLNPSVMEIPSGQKKLVRCALPPHVGASESSFRLIVDELPPGQAQPGTVQAVLRLSIPLFRSPKGAAPALRWREGPLGWLELLNVGRAHATVGRVVVRRAGQEPDTIDRGFYLLAGSVRSLPLTAGSAITGVEVVTGPGQPQAVAKLQR